MASPQVRRTPFGVLNQTRVRALQSVKNRQNALPASELNNKLSTPVKRSAAAFELDNIDSENIDPTSVFTKKAKTVNATPSSTLKPSSFSLTPATIRKAVSPSAKLMQSKPLQSKRNALSASSTPIKKAVSNSRRLSAPITRRIDPPTSLSPPTKATFSIDARLTRPAPRKEQRNEWFFEIYEDTEEEHLSNIMSHSTGVLDISDDESNKLEDDRGKENVPPPDYATNASVATKASLPQTNLMDRSPLNDLPAAEYFPEGLSAASFVVVSADEKKEEPEVVTSALSPVIESTPAVVEELVPQPAPEPIMNDEPAVAPAPVDVPSVEIESTEGNFQIWESGSFDGEAAA